MKVIILAGGLGARQSEVTENNPKPLVRIDDKPILGHLRFLGNHAAQVGENSSQRGMDQ